METFVARSTSLLAKRSAPTLACLSRWCASSSKAEMPPCDFTPEKYSGPISYEDARAIRQNFINPGTRVYYQTPVMIHQGHMQWLWDTQGKRYLDMFAGIVTVSVGHCHPKVVEAAEKQIRKLWHTTNIYLHPPIHEYAEKLASKLPGDLKVIYFTNSGSEANDLALLMARLYTGVYDVIGLRNAYHGMSPYLIGLTALNTWRLNTPAGFGYHHAIHPDPYRGPWGGAHCRDSPVQARRSCECTGDQCSACDKYVDQLEDVLRYSMPKGRAGAFIAESIQGVGGTVQFPKGYLKKAFEMIRAHGGVCIADEVQTGFGRLGTHYWGFETHDVVPDIVTMAKGMGNGIPLAAVVTTPEIAATMMGALHFNTYGGNPISSAIGSKVLDVLEEDGCQQNSHEVGTYLLTEMAKLQDTYDVIGDVRGKGLMTGVELVKDQKSQEPIDDGMIAAIMEGMKDRGVLIGRGGLHANTLRIKPPMCITKDDAKFCVDVLKETLDDVLSK